MVHLKVTPDGQQVSAMEAVRGSVSLLSGRLNMGPK